MRAQKFTSEKELSREIAKRKIYLARWTFGVTVCSVVLIACIVAIACGLYFDGSLTHTQSAGLFTPGILLGIVSLFAGVCLLIARYGEQDELRDLNHQLDDTLEAEVQNWKN